MQSIANQQIVINPQRSEIWLVDLNPICRSLD